MRFALCLLAVLTAVSVRAETARENSTPQIQRAYPGGECPIEEPPSAIGWTKRELEAWRAIWPKLCAGEIVSLNAGDEEPCHPADISGPIPETRFISPTILQLRADSTVSAAHRKYGVSSEKR